MLYLYVYFVITSWQVIAVYFYFTNKNVTLAWEYKVINPEAADIFEADPLINKSSLMALIYSERRDDLLRQKISVDASVNTEELVKPEVIDKYRCNCKYSWLRELHGLTALMMCNSKWEKLFWFSIIAACASYSIYNTNYILTDYGKHQTITRIIIKPVNNLTFPALVFCPKNPDWINYYNVLQDMSDQIGYLENNTFYDLIRFFIAGSGFGNVDLTPFTPDYLNVLNDLFYIWRANRTELELFQFVFQDNGFTCDDFFDSCFSGSQQVNCCDIFEPTFVMMRGRCFRLVDGYAQLDTDETDKMSLYFNYQNSPLLGSDNKSQVVMYIGDQHPEVGIVPRYYLNVHDWNRIWMSQRRISMLPDTDNMCSTADLNQGKHTCLVHTWLEKAIIQPLNCTLPQFKNQLSYVNDLPVCDPLPVIQHYNETQTLDFNGYKCLPACYRVENTIQMMTSIDYSEQPRYAFRLEISFGDLQYEQYEEVSTSSFAGIISELGGQTGLFVGCSVLSFVQLLTGFTVVIYRSINRFYKRNVRIVVDLYHTEAHLKEDEIIKKNEMKKLY